MTTTKTKLQRNSKEELQTLSANLISVFKNSNHIQQAFVLSTTLPRLLKEAKDCPKLLNTWRKAKKILEGIHAQTVEEDTFVKPKSDAFPTKAKRIEKLVADLKIKHGTRDKATLMDFYRICRAEGVEVITNLTKYHYCFSFTDDGVKRQFISIGIKKKFTAPAAYHLLGGLLIPSLHSGKKFFERKISKREFEIKHSQSRYFSELMRGCGGQK